MLKFKNSNIHKSSGTNVNKMARRFVSQSIACEIISFAIDPNDNNTWKIVYVFQSKIHT
jgi:hypothetical protein